MILTLVFQSKDFAVFPIEVLYVARRKTEGEVQADVTSLKENRPKASSMK